MDTEGRDLLREIAVLDSQGKLIYQAWVTEHPDNSLQRIYTQPLKAVLSGFLEIARQHTIVCHNAQHDRLVIQRACRLAKIRFPVLKFVCTVELAQSTFPNLTSYSLEYLSKKLRLKVDQKDFNPRQAHSAKYDTEFTYQLYRKVLDMQASSFSPVWSSLKSQPNPFASSRVDTPFQDHPDQKQIYQQEFEQLKVAIAEIHQDKNHQSRGAVVIGEPGSGKTHLMMRLAQELLKVNRLLFIRHPNNPDAILYHIYSRTLESFIQAVPDTGYTQLEHLISHSFAKLIRTSPHLKLNLTDQIIIATVQDSPLHLYTLAAEGTEKKRQIWANIDKRLQAWWVDNYGFSGYATKILTGIVKFCSYTNPKYKSIVQRWLAADSLSQGDLDLVGLEDWQESMGKEEFSLEAIAVFSKLSMLDEPLLMVFDQLESLGLPHNNTLLLNFGEAVKEIFTHVPNSLIILNLFPDRWQQFQEMLSPAVVDRVSQVQIALQPPQLETLQQILQLRAQAIDVEITDLFTPEDLNVILHQPSIRGMLNCAANYFRYRVNDTPLPTLTTPKRTLAETIVKPVELTIKPVEPTTKAVEPIIEPTVKPVEQRLDRLESEMKKLQQQIQNITLTATEPIFPEDELTQYLQTQRQSLYQEYQNPQITTDSDDLGKLTTIAQAFQLILPLEIDYLRLGKRTLPEHLVLIGKRKVAIGFLQIDGTSFTSRIKNWNELVISDRSTHYQLWRDVRLPEIKGKVGRDEIEKLNYSKHGAFLSMAEEERLDFELIYCLIIDIQNRDLEITLEEALQGAMINVDLEESWLVQLLKTL